MATIAVAAAHVDLSERHFKTLLDSGVIKRAARGDYDLKTVTISYIRHLRQVKQGIEGGGQSTLSNARARSAVASATKSEFDLAVAQGAYCAVAGTLEYIIEHIVLVRENLLTVPGKISDSLHMINREQAFDILETEIYECLSRLASGKPAREFAIAAIKAGGGKPSPKLIALLDELLSCLPEEEPKPKGNNRARLKSTT